MAVGHSILVIAYHVLAAGRPYQELGDDWSLERDRTDAYPDRLVRHKVTLEPLASAA